MLRYDDETSTFSGTDSIACSIKPDGDSNEQKTFTLKVSFEKMTLAEIMPAALKSIRIAWQNGPGRKGFQNWTNGQTIEVDARHPGKTPDTPAGLLQKMFAKGMTKEQIMAQLEAIED